MDEIKSDERPWTMWTMTSYHQEAMRTKVYGAGDKLTYPALGLGGEAGEVLNKIKKIVRDKNGVCDIDTAHAIVAELGDVLWYISAIADDLGLNLNDVAELNIIKLRSRRERDTIQGSGDNR